MFESAKEFFTEPASVASASLISLVIAVSMLVFSEALPGFLFASICFAAVGVSGFVYVAILQTVREMAEEEKREQARRKNAQS